LQNSIQLTYLEYLKDKHLKLFYADAMLPIANLHIGYPMALPMPTLEANCYISTSRVDVKNDRWKDGKIRLGF
jgi:hypothetical protein